MGMGMLKKVLGVCILAGVILYCFPEIRDAIRDQLK